MTIDKDRELLQSRIPFAEGATNVRFIGVRAYFTMPRDFLPPKDSGILSARSHRHNPLGRRWQVRV